MVNLVKISLSLILFHFTGINSGCESLIKHANDIQNECERYSDDSQLQLEASTFLCSMAIQMREVRKYITDLEKIIISEFDIKLFNVDIVLDLIAIVRSQCKNLLRWAENGSYQTDDLQSIRRMRKIYVCAQDEIRRFVKSLNSFLCIKV